MSPFGIIDIFIFVPLGRAGRLGGSRTGIIEVRGPNTHLSKQQAHFKRISP